MLLDVATARRAAAGMRVSLSYPQIMQAAVIGSMRQVHNLQKKRQPRHGAGSWTDWQKHIEGCMGEMALAKHFGAFWDGKVGDLSAGDVGKIEVRTTPAANGHLLVHDWDTPSSVFVLAIGVNGTYTFTGWIRGTDAQKDGPDGFWGDPKNTGRPAYWVPQWALQPFETLPWESKKAAPPEGEAA